MMFGLAKLHINPTRLMGVTDAGSAPLSDLMQYSPSEFTARLTAALAAASKKEVVIFVHGFNNSFEGAARALALMSADIHFGGVPVMFSWPSDGAALRYGSDEEEVRASRDNFLRFVEHVRETAGLERLHVAAHSMGNRLIFEAIDRFDAIQRGKDTKLFYHTVMAAPDLYVQVFETGVEAFRRRVGKTTLYASEKDAALVCSRAVHAGNRRLGEAGPGIFVAAKLETIDATEAEPRPSIFSLEAWSILHWFLRPCEKGHAYMMRSLRMQADLQNLILTDLPPESRHGLEKKDKNGVDYWAFRPSD
ncbi:hypothetical protein ASE66_23340 [Bosea sp. Root483D1]|nr:hypothetical protein ASE66_23340 [Bosea sp. Root483D1]